MEDKTIDISTMSEQEVIRREEELEKKIDLAQGNPYLAMLHLPEAIELMKLRKKYIKMNWKQKVAWRVKYTKLKGLYITLKRKLKKEGAIPNKNEHSQIERQDKKHK